MLADRQDHYWWHRARREMAIGLLRRYGVRSGGCWVELGCGPGGNLGISAQFKPQLTVGIDLSPVAIELARPRVRDACLVQADLNVRLPLWDQSCAVVTIFNVLYHQWILDEKAVLNEVRRILRPRGLVLMTEPAFSILRRDMDNAAMTRRRYRKFDIKALCQQAGLQVLVANYFTSFGFPVLAGLNATRFLSNHFRSKGPAADMRPLPALLNEIMYRTALVEASAIANGIQMPFGTTLVCVAQKP
jgi:SAM-dependent methyltransferase